MYCTYLTNYKGDQLPPLYIGYSILENVENGYHGSVSSQEYKDIWEQELKTHPELFSTIVLSTHDTQKDATDEENRLLRAIGAVGSKFYMNKCAFPHFSGRNEGYTHSEETRKAMSVSHTGKKRRPHSEATKEKMRQTKLGKKLTEEHKKKLSLAKKGKVSTWKGKSPSEETRKKMSKARKEYYKYNKHFKLK